MSVVITDCAFFIIKKIVKCVCVSFGGFEEEPMCSETFRIEYFANLGGEEERAAVGKHVLYILVEIVKPHPKIVYNKYIFSIFI